jgi:hypothetical protein
VFAAGAVVVVALAQGEAAGKPRLSVDLSPFVVVGTGFKAGETVRISVRGAAGGSRSGKASRAGRISVRFPGDVERCHGLLIITAKGDQGSRAQLRSMPRACGIDPGRAP